MVSLVNCHANATRIGWHLLEIDLRFASGLPAGWVRPGVVCERCRGNVEGSGANTQACDDAGFHTETLKIHNLSSIKSTTHTDIY
jgi:hypothetical protein